MGTTSNMAIPYPESSDYVADGATAMENMATQIDDKSGLVLTKFVTVGGPVPSVTVTDCFSSTFDNYQIVVVVDQCTVVGSYVLKFGATTTNYSSTMAIDGFSGTLTGYARTNGGSFMYSALSHTADPSTFTITVAAPNLAKYTQVHGTWQGRSAAGWCGGVLTDTTSYTSFVLTTDTPGTMTGGSIRVYGMNKGF